MFLKHYTFYKNGGIIYKRIGDVYYTTVFVQPIMRDGGALGADRTEYL